MKKDAGFRTDFAAPPVSAVNHAKCLTALLILILVASFLRFVLKPDPFAGFVILLGLISLCCLAIEGQNLKTAWSAAMLARNSPDRATRVAIKLLGLAATYAVIAAAYWAFPYYRSGNANVLLRVLALVWVPILLITPLYVWLVDRSMQHPEDGLYMAGLFASGRWNEIDWMVLRSYALGWLMKAFFLPFMLQAAYGNWTWLHNADLMAVVNRHPVAWYDLAYRLIYSVDLVWAAVGYFFTLRLFGTHIRSTERTLDGWLVCLICYPPFSEAIGPNFLKFNDGFYWGHWLDDNIPLKQLWAVAIISLLIIYCWATIAFGGRFSNLTHRGIITTGPYRWFKHPAYLAKNLSWWMISVPFVSLGEPGESLRLCLLLLGLNAIYYWRAKTEERHLSTHPKYVAYCIWIEDHGVLARLRRASHIALRKLNPPART